MEEQEKSKMNELPTKILASNLPSSAHEEFLEMFFENTKKSGGGPVVSVDYDEESASAVIEFGEPEAVENVLKKQPLKMMGREISVEVFDPEPVTLCTIEVTGPHDLVCEEQLDTLEMYFECRKSLGDEVKEIVFDGNIALVTFFSEEVARRVAEKGDHKINKKAISVKLHSPESEKLIVDRKGFESGEDETTDNHEEVENEPALTVKVKGVKELPSRDTLEYYFDNKGRSGGFDLQEVISDEEDDDVLYVKYQSEEVARAVAERSHVVSGVRLTVSLYTPPRPPPSYRNKILIKGLKPTTTEDALSNFIEAKSGYIPVPGSMIFHAEQEGVVMVTLDRELDFEILEKMCEKRLDGAKLKISKVPISNCIIVSDLAPDVTKDTVEFYFENKRKSNGGPVSKVVMKNENTSFVYFEDYHDARRVAEKSDHMINRKRISVKLLTPESKMQNPEMDREGSERTVDKSNYKPEEAAVKEPSQKMSENLYDIKKVGEHWLLRKAGKRFKKLSALTHAKKVELSDNYLIVDQHLIYEIQELRDDIVIVKIDDIHEYEEGENSVCPVDKTDTYSQRCDPVEVPPEGETLLNQDTVSDLSSVENDMAKSLKSYSSEKQYEEEKQQMEPDIDNILSDSFKVPPKMTSSVLDVLDACDSQKKSTSCLKMSWPDDETSFMDLTKVDSKGRNLNDKGIADKNTCDTLPCDIGPALTEEEVLNNDKKDTTNISNIGDDSYSSLEAGHTEETDVIETIHLNSKTGSSEDATALSKHDKTQFRFQRFDEQELTTFKLTVTDDDLKKLKFHKKDKKFFQHLEKLRAKINEESNGLSVCVETSDQMKYVTGLKKQLLNIVLDGPEVEDITATEEDGYENIDLSIVNVEGVTDQMWQLLQEEKKEKIKEFKKCGGTITHNGNLLTLRRQEVLAGDDIMIKDYVSVFSSFVQQMKDMDFVEISSADEHVANIPMWKNEIEDKLNKRCCTFLEEQKKIIAYGDSFEEVKKVEYFFLLKQGKLKPAIRSRKVATAEDYSGPASLQSAYKENKEDFEWNKNARNVKAYKTEEGLQVYVYEADILNHPVDCIVNVANDKLQHGGGVAQVIANAAGRELTKEGDIYIRKYGCIPVGNVVATTAEKLPYRSVIHAVGPCWADYNKTYKDIYQCEKDLFNAIYNSCVEADRKGFKSVAFPAISQDILGVPGDLCVSQYVKATLAISKTKLASLKEIHFIDKNSDIVEQIQREFKTVLMDGKESPYQRQSYVKGFGRNRTEWRKSSDQAVPFSYQKYGHEVPENLRTVPTSQNKKGYFFEENGTVVYVLGKDETRRLLVYKGDVLEVKSAAIVVTVDEIGTGGALAKGVASKIQVKKLDIYRKELKRQLSLKPSVGQVAITKGYSTHFSHVFHIIFPFVERLKQPLERRKRLTEIYKNVLSAAMKEKNLNIVATALVDIDGKKIEDIDLACSALWDAYLWHLQKLETESISPLDVHLVCLDENQLKRVRSNFNSYIEMIRNTEPETEDHQTSMKHKTEMSKDQDCVICMEQTENPKVLRCGHVFCTACLDSYFEIKKACPTCGAVCGIITGDQPPGDMKYYFSPHRHCTGYERCGQIIITYTFLSGRQEQTHPNPGAWYEGITRTAYLPDNEEGRKILKMLIVAFHRKLVFTIGRSRTTGKEGVITWNDIHHKTDWRSHSQFGYPDETYLQRVTEQLAAKGVTEKDIVDVIL